MDLSSDEEEEEEGEEHNSLWAEMQQRENERMVSELVWLLFCLVSRTTRKREQAQGLMF
jgi:hypothetical protein